MVVVSNLSTSKQADESNIQFVKRMCSNKKYLGLTWKELASLINQELGCSYTESYYRKHFNSGDFSDIAVAETTTTATADTVYTYTKDCNGECSKCDDLPVCLEAWKEDLVETESRIDEKMLKMRKERTKLNDERAENNRIINRLAREETIIEIARDYASTIASKKRLLVPAVTQQFMDIVEEEGILLLSDWHYGMVCDNPWNKFNPRICRQRVGMLLERVVKIIKDRKLHKITVMNLSDLIAGRIHTQIRIESRFDVITQTMTVAEILAEFLTELSLHCSVDYYDCLDNHSRLEPNKNDSMDLESLVRIIPWFLKERLISNPNITINENEFGADIITCNVLGHNVIGVHGDNDRPTNALERLSLMTHKHYDLLCTAHLHHFSADEQHQSVVISNSSLMGVDRYAEKLRVTSDPSQTFIIATKDNVCDCLYRIVLK